MRNAVIDEKVKEILQRPYSRVLIPDEDGGFTAEILLRKLIEIWRKRRSIG